MNEQQLPPLPKPAIANGPGSMFRFNYYTAEHMHAYARAALAANVPAWFVLVPVEPTPEMMRAAVVYANGNAVYKNVAAEALAIEESIYGEVWAAMLAAAPDCTCPSGDGSLRWPCPEHPAPAPEAKPVAWLCDWAGHLAAFVRKPDEPHGYRSVRPLFLTAPAPEAALPNGLTEAETSASPSVAGLTAPAQAQQSSEADEELCRQAMQRWRDAKPEAQQPLHITVLIDWLAVRYRAAGGKEGITDLSAFCEEVMRWTEHKHGIGASGKGKP